MDMKRLGRVDDGFEDSWSFVFFLFIAFPHVSWFFFSLLVLISIQYQTGTGHGGRKRVTQYPPNEQTASFEESGFDELKERRKALTMPMGCGGCGGGEFC
ncbi:hypothetical protein VTJ04DRAFT_2342 [Mycothermus thermophilus]|uniref:uncharacterized protein n=1 Tax=Humicola insolens TaxID=85995 RepID=UPI00374258CA